MVDTQSATTGVRGRRIWLTLAIVAVLLGGALWLYGRGGGPLPASWSFLSPAEFDALAPSGPAETVLRTVRLAGFERAAVGEAGGVAVLRLEMPGVSSAVDAEIGWQIGFAALSVGYADASEYVVQLFEGDRGLLEVSADGAAAREAVEADDPAALREASRFTYLREADGR